MVSKVQIEFFCFACYIFYIKFVGIVFLSFIVSSDVITESSIILVRYLPFLTTTYRRVPNIIVFTYIWYFFHLLWYLQLLRFLYESHFIPSSLYLHLHDICFVKIFNSFITVIILKVCIFKSSVWFAAHNLLDKPSSVLQLPTHISDLTANR